MIDERCDEDRLSGSREACNSKTDMRASRQLNEALRRGASFENDVGEERQNKNPSGVFTK
jgi:hypothetical protein